MTKLVTQMTVTSLEQLLANREAALKHRLAQLRTMRGGLQTLKNTWSDVGNGLHMASAQRELLCTLGALLPNLGIPDHPQTVLDPKACKALFAQARHIDQLVRDISNPRLAQLWKARTYASLYEMVHVLVATAPAANNSDFGGIEVVEMSEMPALRQG